MGNRALRRKVVELLKSAEGTKKLYSGPKLLAYRYLKAKDLKFFIKFLSYKPGDIVHDCDGFNHRISKIDEINRIRCGLRNVLTIDFDNQVKFEDGKLSCGCPGSPFSARTKEEITEYFKRYCSGESEKYLKDYGWWNDRIQEIYECLRDGKDICDEDGICILKQ